MHPELFRIPFTQLTVKSYGVMMVCGFISAIYIIRRLSREIGDNEEHITTAALYSLIAGVVGARVFYVIHYWQDFKGARLINMFAVWDGGLELLGGVLLAVLVIGIYLRVNKLPVRRCLDILAVGLMLALVFGRIGCLLSGCCYGSPTKSVIGIRFPYGSNAYLNQIRPDPARNRAEPYFQLPDDFFIVGQESRSYLKPFDQLTPQQRFEVTDDGPFRCLPVWPTQPIESLCALAATILLYLHRKKGIDLQKRGGKVPFFFKSGITFALMFIIYGTMRFFIEFLRGDNPFGFDGLTISQNLGIVLVISSFLLIWLFAKMKPDKFPIKN